MGLRSRAVTNKCGFSLVELLLVVAMSSLVVAAVHSAFVGQNRTYVAQESVAEMQQNIRVSLDMLTRDIRMAGYDPTGSTNFGFVNTADADFSNGAGSTEDVTTGATQIAFTKDLNKDGAIDRVAVDIDGNGNKDMSEMEQVAYRLNGTALQRYSTTTGADEWQTVAEGIENIEFYYTFADGTAKINPLASDLSNIQSIQVSILARAGRLDREYTNNTTYTTASGVNVVVNDNFRRRQLIATVECRNMGL